LSWSSCCFGCLLFCFSCSYNSSPVFLIVFFVILQVLLEMLVVLQENLVVLFKMLMLLGLHQQASHFKVHFYKKIALPFSFHVCVFVVCLFFFYVACFVVLFDIWIVYMLSFNFVNLWLKKNLSGTFDFEKIKFKHFALAYLHCHNFALCIVWKVSHYMHHTCKCLHSWPPIENMDWCFFHHSKEHLTSFTFIWYFQNISSFQYQQVHS